MGGVTEENKEPQDPGNDLSSGTNTGNRAGEGASLQAEYPFISGPAAGSEQSLRPPNRR